METRREFIKKASLLAAVRGGDLKDSQNDYEGCSSKGVFRICFLNDYRGFENKRKSFDNQKENDRTTRIVAGKMFAYNLSSLKYPRFILSSTKFVEGKSLNPNFSFSWGARISWISKISSTSTPYLSSMWDVAPLKPVCL